VNATVRSAAVAGRFYPGDPHILLSDIQSFLSPQATTVPAMGCVVPHAGYIYSGHVAGAVFARLDLPQRFIILCPNHTGRGTPLSIMSQGSWQTPLGPAPIDEELAEKLKRQFPLLSEDAEAHRAEHAIEVELPFLQALRPAFTFVPIAVGTGQFNVLEELGLAIAETVGADGEYPLIIASSDMNHYESDSITRVKDHKAIECILALDPAGLHKVVTQEKISMCGIGPTVAMLTAAKRLGATSPELTKYATSGDVSGDREMVVGYAGIVVR
jgi:AmmeMemoRadiSam system protein B